MPDADPKAAVKPDWNVNRGTPPFAPAIDAHVHIFPDRLAEARQRALTAATGCWLSHTSTRQPD